MKIYKHQDIEGMSLVGTIHNYEVYVNTHEGGKIPHFHFRDEDDWGKFHTCIRIDKAQYFHHTGKEDVLNSKLKKELQNFMSSKPTNDKYSRRFNTNWEVMCFLWDINNSDVIIPDDVEQPDYRNLK